MENMILGEHPRPDMKRKDITVLNGLWEYGVSDGRREEFDREILVPFSAESELSGIKRTLMPDETAYYRKNVPLRKEEGFRYILTFLAVDYYTKLFINGREILKDAASP